MINRILKISGIIAIAFVIFIFGYSVGKTPSTKDDQLKQADMTYKADLFDLSAKYGKLYNLCEDKYQAAIGGDMTGAYQLKGQMDILQSEINTIMKRYPTAGL